MILHSFYILGNTSCPNSIMCACLLTLVFRCVLSLFCCPTHCPFHSMSFVLPVWLWEDYFHDVFLPTHQQTHMKEKHRVAQCCKTILDIPLLLLKLCMNTQSHLIYIYLISSILTSTGWLVKRHERYMHSACMFLKLLQSFRKHTNISSSPNWISSAG